MCTAANMYKCRLRHVENGAFYLQSTCWSGENFGHYVCGRLWTWQISTGMRIGHSLFLIPGIPFLSLTVDVISDIEGITIYMDDVAYMLWLRLILLG